MAKSSGMAKAIAVGAPAGLPARKHGFELTPAMVRVLVVLELTGISVLSALYFGMLPI